MALANRNDEDILHRLLAEVVVDPEDLFLLKDRVDLRVQRLGTLEVATERFLDHDPRPSPVALAEARVAEVLNDVAIDDRRHRQVEEAIARAAIGGLLCLDPFLEPPVRLGVVVISLQIRVSIRHAGR